MPSVASQPVGKNTAQERTSEALDLHSNGHAVSVYEQMRLSNDPQ